MKREAEGRVGESEWGQGVKVIAAGGGCTATSISSELTDGGIRLVSQKLL